MLHPHEKNRHDGRRISHSLAVDQKSTTPSTDQESREREREMPRRTSTRENRQQQNELGAELSHLLSVARIIIVTAVITAAAMTIAAPMHVRAASAAATAIPSILMAPLSRVLCTQKNMDDTGMRRRRRRRSKRDKIDMVTRAHIECIVCQERHNTHVKDPCPPPPLPLSLSPSAPAHPRCVDLVSRLSSLRTLLHLGSVRVEIPTHR